jgi:membrane protease YdiL (CAAX protease family)
MKKRLERHTEIDFEKTHSFISLLLLVSLLFFIIVIQILGNAAILFDMLDSSTLTEIAETMASQITPIGYILNTIFVFFISFFGPLAYIGLTKNLNPKESLKVLKLKLEKRSLLYALLGVAAFGVFFESINALWILLQNIFGIELQENVVAVSMGSGLNLFSAFFISLLTAFGEELFFRGFLQNRAGVLITTIIFTLSHISYANVGEIVQVFIFSLIMGYGVKKTGNLGFAIGMHFINNFVTFIYILYFL